MASSWWYGVALFPLVAVMRLLSQFRSRRFIIASSSGTDPNVAAGIASFVLAVASFWAGSSLRSSSSDACSRTFGHSVTTSAGHRVSVWSLAGFAHLGGAVFSPLLLASVPTLTSYLYRRRDRLGHR